MLFIVVALIVSGVIEIIAAFVELTAGFFRGFLVFTGIFHILLGIKLFHIQESILCHNEEIEKIKQHLEIKNNVSSNKPSSDTLLPIEQSQEDEFLDDTESAADIET